MVPGLSKLLLGRSPLSQPPYTSDDFERDVKYFKIPSLPSTSSGSIPIALSPSAIQSPKPSSLSLENSSPKRQVDANTDDAWETDSLSNLPESGSLSPAHPSRKEHPRRKHPHTPFLMRRNSDMVIELDDLESFGPEETQFLMELCEKDEKTEQAPRSPRLHPNFLPDSLKSRAQDRLAPPSQFNLSRRPDFLTGWGSHGSDLVFDVGNSMDKYLQG
jgi:hypothetical protein